MNPETPPVIEEHAKSLLGALEPSPMSEGKGWKRIVSAPVKVLWGMFFAQSMLGGLLVMGWTQRFMQRTVLKQWWEAGGKRTGENSFAEFLKSDSRTHGHLDWPNWFAQPKSALSPPVAETPERTDSAKTRGGFGALFGSFFLNLKLGLQGFFNVALFTLPGCVLMSLGWYDGWQNSFNKGYESLCGHRRELARHFSFHGGDVLRPDGPGAAGQHRPMAKFLSIQTRLDDCAAAMAFQRGPGWALFDALVAVAVVVGRPHVFSANRG